MTSNYSLFLDDERYPPSVSKSNWVICRTFEEATEVIEKMSFPDFISFDHDLGEGKSGYDFAKWLTDRDMDRGLFGVSFPFSVHSMNPAGRQNIEDLLYSYFYHKTTLNS